jgi:hypothetical protein
MAFVGLGQNMHDAVWEAEFDALAFTAEALFAHPDPDDQELGQLARRVSSVLADWEEIDAAGRGLRRYAIHTAARVRAADAALDYALGLFAADLLKHTGSDRNHELYKRFFPELHEEVIEMGLDASLPIVMTVTLALDQDDSLPQALREHADELKTAVQMGNGSLAGRADALAELGRHQARVEAWKETALATHNNLFRAVGRIAEQRGLPRRWVRSFFLQPPPAFD